MLAREQKRSRGAEGRRRCGRKCVGSGRRSVEGNSSAGGGDRVEVAVGIYVARPPRGTIVNGTEGEGTFCPFCCCPALSFAVSFFLLFRFDVEEKE